MLQGDGMEWFEYLYHWMMEQYNKRKGHEFSSAPVWWYTDKKEAQRNFLREDHQLGYEERDSTATVLIKAEVPDKWVLLHDSERWYCPLNNASCGWGAHPLFSSNTWTPEFDVLWDKLHNLYENNQEAKEETWKEIFNISKDGHQNLHAVTPFIDLYWIEAKKVPDENYARLEQEM